MTTTVTNAFVRSSATRMILQRSRLGLSLSARCWLIWCWWCSGQLPFRRLCWCRARIVPSVKCGRISFSISLASGERSVAGCGSCWESIWIGIVRGMHYFIFNLNFSEEKFFLVVLGVNSLFANAFWEQDYYHWIVFVWLRGDDLSPYLQFLYSASVLISGSLDNGHVLLNSSLLSGSLHATGWTFWCIMRIRSL